MHKIPFGAICLGMLLGATIIFCYDQGRVDKYVAINSNLHRELEHCAATSQDLSLADFNE